MHLHKLSIWGLYAPSTLDTPTATLPLVVQSKFLMVTPHPPGPLLLLDSVTRSSRVTELDRPS